jgi:hypothetical protein
MEVGGSWKATVTPALEAFLSELEVERCHIETPESLKMQHICSEALLAVFAIAYARISCVGIVIRVRFPPPPLDREKPIGIAGRLSCCPDRSGLEWLLVTFTTCSFHIAFSAVNTPTSGPESAVF